MSSHSSNSSQDSSSGFADNWMQQATTSLRNLQSHIADQLKAQDPSGDFYKDNWQRDEGGGGSSWIWRGGEVFESAGINFSHIQGKHLPPSATAKRPELANAPFSVTGVSLVFHPVNPYVPTTHANVRFFCARPEGRPAIWWFGGGFDLTPYYPFAEDVYYWHQQAKASCDPFGAELYPQFKKQCDEYFYLPHRNETRGVGGIFYDDLQLKDFETSLSFTESVGQHFAKAYFPIVAKRKPTPYGEREKNFQLYRRGRYVEFNLLFDRGTLFGIQSKGRTESILMSLPPQVRWEYSWQPEAGSREEQFYRDYLRPRDWLNELSAASTTS